MIRCIFYYHKVLNFLSLVITILLLVIQWEISIYPNFELSIAEKSPQINSIDPISKSDFDNSSITTFTISGDNLFGLPDVSLSYKSTTLSIKMSGVAQSRNALTGLTLASSLFPDTWTLSVTNSRGSTSKTIVVTEPVPEVKSFDPTQVPFNDRTKITITGDHFLGSINLYGFDCFN